MHICTLFSQYSNILGNNSINLPQKEIMDICSGNNPIIPALLVRQAFPITEHVTGLEYNGC